MELFDFVIVISLSFASANSMDWIRGSEMMMARMYQLVCPVAGQEDLLEMTWPCFIINFFPSNEHPNNVY